MNITYLMSDIFIDLGNNDGASLHVSHIVSQLAALGHAVRLLALTRRRRGRPTLDATWVRGYTPRADLLFPLVAYVNSHRLNAACNWRTTVVHERFSALNHAGVMLARRHKAPLVLEVNAPLFEEWSSHHQPGWFEKATSVKTTRHMLQHATRIIAVSNTLAAMLVDRWGVAARKIIVLPNAVNVADFAAPLAPFTASALRAQYGLGNQSLCMFVGSLQRWHGVELLIQAFAAAVGQRTDWRLVIVGDGPKKTQLEQVAQMRRIQDRVTFVGAVPHGQVPSLLALADLCVLPYPAMRQFYFSPLKLFEYMAASKAIVASAQGQIAEWLTHEVNALLVAPGDVAALKQALLALLDAPEQRQRLGQQAYARVQANTWPRYAEALVGIYQAALDESMTDSRWLR